MKPEWRPNVEEFRKRFDPERTKGQGVCLNLFNRNQILLR